jgi:dienelactone hydrolase
VCRQSSSKTVVPHMSDPAKTSELPDLFRFADGRPVASAADWPARRQELLASVLAIEYGQLPPAPARTRYDALHRHEDRNRNGARHDTVLISVGWEQTLAFELSLTTPGGDGPFPVALCGDGCWHYADDAVLAHLLARGWGLATFNRCVLAPDDYTGRRDMGLYQVHPAGDYGALAAWAWGYHRCIDYLQTRDDIDHACMMAIGHSRGGKAVLLAGATDERIAVTAPNNSGCGGAGCFRWLGDDCEAASDIMTNIPYWFSPRLHDYVGREHALPFDQHAVKALVAPRVLVTTEALGDLWANPTGTWQTHAAAAEAYRLLDADSRIGIWYREGRHNHGLVDWQAALDFADWQVRGGTQPDANYASHPFGDLPAAFHWRAPR